MSNGKSKYPRKHLPLSEILERLNVERWESAHNGVARCRNHGDENPSLAVIIEKSRIDPTKVRVGLTCRSRGKACRFLDMLDAEGLTNVDLQAVENDVEGIIAVEASDTSAVDVPAGEVAALVGFLDHAHKGLIEGTSPAAQEVLDYLSRRFGVDLEDVRRLGLGVTIDATGPRLVIPLRDSTGRRRNWQGRAMGDGEPRWTGPKRPTAGRWTPVGKFEGRAHTDEMLVTEGLSDALTAVSAGYDAIAVAGATRATEAGVIDEILTMLKGRTAVLAGDADPAGHTFNAALRMP